MNDTKAFAGYYEMMKKFAEDNKLQTFTLKIIVEYNQAGNELVTDFYAEVKTASGRLFGTANKDFNGLLTLLESYTKL